MAWYTGLAIRKYAIVTIDINKTYDIEVLTGMSFSNPKVFYSIVEYYASTPKHHIKLEYTISYPNIRFNNIGNTGTIYSAGIWNNNATNKVRVFITEGDYGIQD